MKTFEFTAREIWFQTVTVKAENEKEALALIQEGDGDYIGEPWYHETIDYVLEDDFEEE